MKGPKPDLATLGAKYVASATNIAGAEDSQSFWQTPKMVMILNISENRHNAVMPTRPLAAARVSSALLAGEIPHDHAC